MKTTVGLVGANSSLGGHRGPSPGVGGERRGGGAPLFCFLVSSPVFVYYKTSPLSPRPPAVVVYLHLALPAGQKPKSTSPAHDVAHAYATSSTKRQRPNLNQCLWVLCAPSSPRFELDEVAGGVVVVPPRVLPRTGLEVVVVLCPKEAAVVPLLVAHAPVLSLALAHPVGKR